MHRVPVGPLGVRIFLAGKKLVVSEARIAAGEANNR
jgi:hypothetical protein